MELWLTLVALIAWQCAVRVPAGSAVFGPAWYRGADLSLRGLQWLSPWPSTPGIVATRLPFHVTPDGVTLVADADPARSRSPIPRPPPTHALDGPAPIEERGMQLHVGGRPFVASASKAGLRVWHRMARVIADAPRAERFALWQGFVADTLDVDRLVERWTEARRITRGFRVLCDLHFGCAVVGVPALAVAVGAEPALALAWPGLAALHLLVVGWGAYVHRSLLDDPLGERAQQIAMALLYPPAVWRWPAQLVDAATAGAHPLAWLAVIGAPARAEAEWAREIARLERRAAREPESAVWLAAWTHAIRASREHALAERGPRRPRDPDAASYCPVCLDEFRAGFDHCHACESATIRYGVPVST